jgi:hypothetical protein
VLGTIGSGPAHELAPNTPIVAGRTPARTHCNPIFRVIKIHLLVDRPPPRRAAAAGQNVPWSPRPAWAAPTMGETSTRIGGLALLRDTTTRPTPALSAGARRRS